MSSTDCPNCPKCSSNDSSYIFCKDCITYYCMTCNINYYIENDKIILNHNPHCNNNDSMSEVDLSDIDID